MLCTTYVTPGFPRITLASDGENLAGLWFEAQQYFGSSILENAEPREDLPVFDQAKRWLDRYFAGEAPTPAELPLAPIGSEFRQRVWRKLLAIPYGQTRTYGELARELAAEDGRAQLSAQAVGGAVGHNPLSIVIPCHRVIGANGNLTGYAGGIHLKAKLLELEGIDLSHLRTPKGTVR